MGPKKDTEVLAPQTADYVALAAKAVLGATPIVGSLLVELAGVVVPNQRIDRIAEFARDLETKITRLEQAFVQSQLDNPEFSSLLEEGLQQAARAVSSGRRAQIAELIARSLGGQEIAYAESEHLLRLLRDLNDVEIIRLGSYLHQSFAPDDYREKHKDVLAPALASFASPQSEKDRAALQQSYDQHLERLWLLRVRYAVDSSTKLPEFDSRTGAQKIRGYGLTPLGELLCRQIGLS